MVTGERLQALHEHGWRMGLANLLKQENGKWWRTRRSLVRTAIWTVVICGILAGLLFAPESDIDPGMTRLGQGLALFALLVGTLAPIALTVRAQDALIGEKQSGTAAWVLSKPVSRVAVIVSKLVANALGGLVTMVLLPGAVFYVLLAAATGQFVAPQLFLAGLAVMCVNLLFYLTLTIFLGTVFDSRGPVIGIPLIIVLGFQLVLALAPWLMMVTPWGLISPNIDESPSLAVALFQGQAPVSWLPLICTVAWTALFLGLAIRQYGRQEF